MIVGKLILAPDQNPKGRRVIQAGTSMYVLSECCDVEMDAMHRTVGKVYLRCTNCQNMLQENPNFWSSVIVNLKSAYNEAQQEWAAWGLYMLGLEDFGMTVEE